VALNDSDLHAPGAASETRRPLIGLPTYYGRSQHGAWDVHASFLPAVYIEAVSQAGGRVALLPPVQSWNSREVAELDGLILTGGEDIDPLHYGAQRGAHTGPANTSRDTFESTLYVAARAAGLPVLGICRGAQLINAVHGGTLHQHLPTVPGLDQHQGATSGMFLDVDVSTEAGSVLAAVIGPSVRVRCHHHQGLDTIGSGLRISAHAADGCIEGIEGCDSDSDAAPMLVAVQWHPEETPDDLRLFSALVAAAGKRQSIPKLREDA
jgi:putative glutamine amidotransferase